MNVVRLANISYRRGTCQILSDISWTLESGHHWALLGANGSGKTTLLKIVTGYEWCTEGEVEVLGERFGQCDLHRLRQRIGWVSSALAHRLNDMQSAGQTARDIVLSGIEASIGLYRDFSAEEQARSRQNLALLGIPDLADRRYALLSQGEQQRVLIARALINNPALLILDEPCAGLDPAARRDFLADLARLASRDHAPAMVLVTHHIEEIGPWIDRVLVLKAGRILAAGPTGEVLNSDNLSRAFDDACTVERDGAGYRLRLNGSA